MPGADEQQSANGPHIRETGRFLNGRVKPVVESDAKQTVMDMRGGDRLEKEAQISHDQTGHNSGVLTGTTVSRFTVGCLRLAIAAIEVRYKLRYI